MPRPETRLALANVELLSAARVLLVGWDDVELPEALASHGDVHAMSTSLPAHRTLSATTGYDTSFEAWITTTTPFEHAVIRLPKEAERLRMQIAMARSVLEPRGRITVIGHNKAGIRSAGKALAEHADEPEVLDTRYHCRGWSARVAAPAVSSLEDWRTTYAVEIAGEHLEVDSLPGVFARGRLDDGTRLLLETIDPPAGRALDVGCGSGVIAAYLSRRGVATDAVDADAPAVEAARGTLAREQAAGRVRPSDVYSDVDGPYAAIVSNPPFHAGIATTHAVTRRLVEGAPAQLVPGGELWLVANRFLDHLTPLRESFDDVEVAAETPRYRVYRAR